MFANPINLSIMNYRILFVILVGLILISCKKVIPVASFTFSPNSPEVGEVVTFTNQSEDASSSDWDFGDGTSSQSDNPTHIYTDDGDFSVELKATSEDGSNSISQSITVTHPLPVADFSMDMSTAPAGEDITFTNLSENATSYSWDFGDGTTSSIANPTHDWEDVGIYTVQLTATGPGGTDDISKDVTIIIPTNIFPGVGVRDIELVETWATVEAKMGDDVEYLGYYIDNSNYISHVWESMDLGVYIFLVSPTASFSPSSDDILWLMGLWDNFIGQTTENIMMGSLASEVVVAYGDPDRYDTTNDAYRYDRLGIDFFYNGSNRIDQMLLFLADSKKRTGIPSSRIEDFRNIKSRLQK